MPQLQLLPAQVCSNTYIEVFIILIPILEPELNLGVCVPCKRAKTRCRFVTGATICKRCETKNLSAECIIDPPKSRARPSKPGNQPTTSGRANNIPSSTQRKRNNSDTGTSGQSRPAKHPRLASHSSHSRQTPLNSIAEEDESLADTLVGYPEHNRTLAVPSRLMGKTQFIDALADGDNDEGIEGSDMEDSAEEVDIEISSTSSGGSEEELEDEDLSDSLSKPVARRQLHSHSHTMPVKSTKSQSQSTRPRTKRDRTPSMENTYDPSTCREWLTC